MNQTSQGDAIKTKGSASDIDKYVGQRIKMKRRLAGSSQSEMADQLNITFQQIQKYERGTNRVSAGRLFEIAQFLNVPVSYFFEGYSQDAPEIEQDQSDENVFEKKETIKLIKSFYSIEDKSIRQSLLTFMKALSDNPGSHQN